MKRKIVVKDGDFELILPVTPDSYTVTAGVKIETVNIDGIGDVVFGGHGSLASVKIESFFPAQAYPFASLIYDDPYDYIGWLKMKSWTKTVLRFIVTDTDVNIPVLIESIDYGEKDGTNDVTYTLTLQEYREVRPLSWDDGQGQRADEPVANQTDVKEYTIQGGDTLSAICLSHYGNASLYPQLAEYNGIANPNIIFAGDTLRLPPVSVLGG